MKTCCACKRALPEELFHLNGVRNGKQRRAAACAACTHLRRQEPGTKTALLRMSFEQHLMKKYGITAEDWARAFNKQNGKCAICDTTLVLNLPKGGRTVVDHCHWTGQFRGLLCITSNTGLGCFFENSALFLKAVEYIGAHK